MMGTKTGWVMTLSAARPAIAAPPQVDVRDDRLPAAEVILGPEIVSVMDLAIAEAGGTLEAIERRQVLYKPGRRLLARFAARVSWKGRLTDETLVAVTDSAGLPDGSLVVGDG